MAKLFKPVHVTVGGNGTPIRTPLKIDGSDVIIGDQTLAEYIAESGTSKEVESKINSIRNMARFNPNLEVTPATKISTTDLIGYCYLGMGYMNIKGTVLYTEDIDDNIAIAIIPTEYRQYIKNTDKIKLVGIKAINSSTGDIVYSDERVYLNTSGIIEWDSTDITYDIHGFQIDTIIKFDPVVITEDGSTQEAVLSDVAYTGSYGDLINTPDMSKTKYTALVSTNLDDLKVAASCGKYYTVSNNTVTNTPEGVSDFELEVIRLGESTVRQVVVSTAGNYYRDYNGTSWTDWRGGNIG